MIHKNWTELIRPKRLEVDPDTTHTPTYGKFSCDPLERGFGTTLGNALRRVLLSSLRGAAITGVNIHEVHHEFSAIPGILEDVTEILLNLKQVRLKRAAAKRRFRSVAQLKLALVEVVREAGREAHLKLIRAHPELAGKAMVSRTLTAESTVDQGKAGLTDCTAAEFAKLQQLNADYNAKFGFPFILAVRGPRGLGLTKTEIIATFERRLDHPVDYELAECLRNIHRIAEIRLNDKFGVTPELGTLVLDWAEQLATSSDSGYAERGQLTVTYLTDAHRACAQRLSHWMRTECGFDDVEIDAVGNVVGVYHAADRDARRLLTGSHYDTVCNGGKYDGRLGIFVPMACVRELSRSKRRLPFGLEVVGFAEEEGQRYRATFLGSGALAGQFDLDSSEIRLPIGKGLAGTVAATGGPIVIHDAYSDPRFDRSSDERSGFTTRSMLCVPIRNRGERIVGVLQLLNKRAGDFGSDDLDFLASLSENMAIAMENAMLHKSELEKNRMERELQLGREIQSHLLPAPPRGVPSTRIAATSHACFEVGGDYFDFITTKKGKLGVVIADVSGKGTLW